MIKQPQASLCNPQPGSSTESETAFPGLLQGMDGVGEVEVSLATGVVSLEVIAEDPMDAAFVQVGQRAAALLLVSDLVHAMAWASGLLSVCNGMGDRPVYGRALTLGQCLHVTRGSCRAQSCTALVQNSCSSAGAAMFGAAAAWVTRWWSGGPQGQTWHSGMLPWCIGACSTAVALT